jgi:16S rRNA processing protein RimM
LSKIPPDNLLLIGEVIRPHGLDGHLRVLSYARSEKSFLNAGTVFLKPDHERTFAYKVLSVKPHKNILLMQLDGLSSLDEAERYRGAEILINKDTLISDTKDDFFWFDLIGLKVYLNTGEYVGVLRDIFSTGSNDIYIVREGDKEYLIPAIHDVVENIDLKNKKMIIAEMEGLLDLNAV